jgi:hypothetical protein
MQYLNPVFNNIQIMMKNQITLAAIGCTLMTMLVQNPVSANYGTNRKPLACPSRKAPAKGAPSLQQAQRYFTCHAELEVPSRSGSPAVLNLISNLNMQIAPRARRYSSATDREGGLNYRLNKPLGLTSDLLVYDIQGSYTNYSCFNGVDCKIEQFNDSRGVCFQNAFGDWHCAMVGAPESSTERRGPAPQ